MIEGVLFVSNSRGDISFGRVHVVQFSFIERGIFFTSVILQFASSIIMLSHNFALYDVIRLFVVVYFAIIKKNPKSKY